MTTIFISMPEMIFAFFLVSHFKRKFNIKYIIAYSICIPFFLNYFRFEHTGLIKIIPFLYIISFYIVVRYILKVRGSFIITLMPFIIMAICEYIAVYKLVLFYTGSNLFDINNDFCRNFMLSIPTRILELVVYISITKIFKKRGETN